MIIDCHGHFTTEPQAQKDWRDRQLKLVESGPFKATRAELSISDDEIREGIDNNQKKLQDERGTDYTIFSPRAVGMGHHLGTAETSMEWTQLSNDMIRRVCDLYPDSFIPVCALPQYPGVNPKNCIPELERCVNEMGFIGCNLNPDASGAMWSDPPMTDKDWWYPLYEKLVELDVPAMIHVSGSCNPNFHHTGAHYIAADTTVFMQLILGDLFKDFPTLKFIIPHGGGAVPYHWGRYRGLAQMQEKILDGHLMNNVYFDTCVYHQAGIDCLTKVIPTKNILFASEMVGAVRGDDPTTGHAYDDTKRYIDATPNLSDAEKKQVFEDNARAVFPRLKV